MNTHVPSLVIDVLSALWSVVLTVVLNVNSALLPSMMPVIPPMKTIEMVEPIVPSAARAVNAPIPAIPVMVLSQFIHQPMNVPAANGAGVLYLVFILGPSVLNGVGLSCGLLGLAFH
jgi:hypothetical protein